MVTVINVNKPFAFPVAGISILVPATENWRVASTRAMIDLESTINLRNEGGYRH
jgi:hypothetical protein